MNKIAIAACSVGLGIGAAQASTIDAPFTSFVVFGDSLSDDGNLFAATTLDPGVPPTPASPPYFEGRFSNGPVWAEAVDDLFPTAENFAFGGAQAASGGDPAPDFADQIALFDANPISSNLGDRPLASIWFGANDLFGSFLSGGAIPAPTAIADATLALTLGLTDLRADFDDFLIFNLPDLGSTPAFSGVGPGPTIATDAFNLALDGIIAGLEASGANVTLIDINSLFDDLLADPTAFGVSDATTPCLIPAVVDPSTGAELAPASLCSPAESLERAFFDPVHPNFIIQSVIADEVIDDLGLTPVPLPAGLPLLLVGLGALGLVGRRAKSGDART